MVGNNKPVTAYFVLLIFCGEICLNSACSVFCPEGEIICTCSDGRPEPTPDPISGIVISDSCGGKIHFCSVGGVCKPEDHGCPAGRNQYTFNSLPL